MNGPVDDLLVRPDGFLPKERYTTVEFSDLELERLWPHVWQIAGREEELGAPGDFLEYTIGDDSIVVVRTESGRRSPGSTTRAVTAGHASSTDAARSTRARSAAPTTRGRTRSTAGSYVSRSRGVRGPARRPRVSARSGSIAGAGSCSSTWISTPNRCSTSSTRCPRCWRRTGSTSCASARTARTIIAANWKAVVDAFNESYHVQGLHEQILPWTDDTSIAYEQFERHSHYGRLPGARRELRPSPRLGLAPDEYDEGEILGALVAGLGGAFLGEEREAVAELRASGPPPGSTLLGAYQERRMTLLAERGFDVSGFTPDLMTSADDVFWFPNFVGPVYPGQRAALPRAPERTRSQLFDQGHVGVGVAAPGAEWQMPERRFYPDWHERKWGEITEQDYTNLANVQRGMRSRGFDGSRLASKQESNVLHMHRVVDRYLTDRV